MKKCPTCQKTFDDNMRFCQTDGTPLVEAAEPTDPYKTMVASKDEIAAALGSAKGSAAPQQDEVLEIPPQQSQGTPAFQGGPSVSAGTGEPEGQVMEIPPLVDSSQSQEPKFGEPSLSPPPFGDINPPSSPFSDRPSEAGTPRYQETMPPIPSPFSDSGNAPQAPRERPEFGEADTVINQPPAFEPYQPASSPLEKASSQSDWTPPPAPDANWQNQPIGQNTPFQTPPAGAAAGQNKILPIISLVLGILSLCCYVSPVTGIAALITGFMGLKNIKRDPIQFGGKPLALVGMILGGLFFVIGLAYWAFILFFGGLSMLSNLPR